MITKKFIKYFFSSFLISFKKFSRNFNDYILHLVCAFFAFLGFFATSGFAAGSGVVLRVEILSKLFLGNNLLLRLLRTFSCTK